MDPESQLKSRLKAGTDRCVLCGMCLPCCPTYAITRSEAESPRGRISLIRALSEHKLEPTESLVRHLDNCLVCRACERVCPSEVPYGRIIADARQLLAGSGAESGDTRAVNGVVGRAVTTGKGQGLTRAMLRAYQSTGIQSLARNAGLVPRSLSRLDALLPKLPPRRPFKEFYPACGEKIGTVGLFAGCTGKALDQEALHSAIELLTRCGYSVRMPREHVCCGSLHRNAGDGQKADQLARQAFKAFSAVDVDAIVGIATGCDAALAEFAERPDADEVSSGFGVAKVRDIGEFLVSEWAEALKPAPLPATVAVHEPCSLTNVLRQKGITARLLEHIPELLTVPVGGSFCCGAAGTYTLEHPDTADALGNGILREVEASGADILVSPNIGCALHLAATARRNGLSLRVVHPVVLLAQQLREGYK